MRSLLAWLIQTEFEELDSDDEIIKPEDSAADDGASLESMETFEVLDDNEHNEGLPLMAFDGDNNPRPWL